jgi:hypothetical protein
VILQVVDRANGDHADAKRIIAAPTAMGLVLPNPAEPEPKRV